MSMIPTNIRIQFGNEMVLLKDALDVQTTKSGVKISMKSRPGNTYQPFAEASYDVVRGKRPKVTAVDWVDTEVQ
jgi:hypothetical protein